MTLWAGSLKGNNSGAPQIRKHKAVMKSEHKNMKIIVLHSETIMFSCISSKKITS